MPDARLAFDATTATTVVLDGRELVAFGGCNYLGLAHHPAVIDALQRGARETGVSSGASRETTGNHVAHEELERDLAQFLGTQSALLAPDGYLANLVVAQALAPDHSIALFDAKSHASVRDAIAAAGFESIEYEHAKASSAARALAAHPHERVAIFTDGVFPSLKHVAPLPELLANLPAERGTLVVDDCHGFGVLGARGRGTCEHFELADPRIVITATMSKAFGCHGGVIAGSLELIASARERSRAHVGSTPIPPALARAGSAALRELQRDPARLTRLRANIERLRAHFRELGLPASDLALPVFAFTLAAQAEMERVHRRLLAAGLLVPLIDYPDVPGGYFRVVVNAEHTIEQIDRLARELALCLR